MFALSHGHRPRVGVAALAVWHASVVPLGLGLLLGIGALAAAGGILLLGACLAAAWFAVDVARHRRRRPEAPLVHLLIGLASAVAAVALMTAAWAGDGDLYRAAVPATRSRKTPAMSGTATSPNTTSRCRAGGSTCST